MTNNGEAHGGPVMCPGCGTGDTVPVAEVRRGKDQIRLALAPNTTGDGCANFVEGTVIAGLVACGGAYYADDRGWPWLLPAGIVAALLVMVGTVAVIRSEGKDKRRVRAGADRAAGAAAGARFCSECDGVFFPSGGPWAGVATPERFRHHVWTAGGYGDQLDEKAKAAAEEQV
ncbi:MrpF/PhaF family protein [Streptomyces sp. NPDC051563]|uniref:MrpF/PhaF family protein n=1 Tax=Streptomyces sp. NPDC051563 TaxID=3365659 RepID=UPI0037979622